MSEAAQVLTVHAVDNWGEEGILADSAVLQEFRCNPVAVVTAVLVSCRDGVEALEGLPSGLVARQFETAVTAGRPAAGRTGILRDKAQVELVASLLQEFEVPQLVVAPVLRVGGVRILDEAGLEATRRRLFPLSRVVLVRASDLRELTGDTPSGLDSLKRAASSLRRDGAGAVLVAGYLGKNRVVDLLDDDGTVSIFDSARIVAPRVSGLSGAHASALAANLARGEELVRSVSAAQRYVGFRLKRGR